MSTPTITLKELIRLSFPEALEEMSPAVDLSGVISWVATSLDNAQPGELLLTRIDDLTPKAISKAQKKRCSAILVLGGIPTSEITAKSRLPLIPVLGENDFRSVHRNLLTILINQRAYLIERGVRLHNQLAQLSAEGGGIEALACATSEVSGRGVFIQDKRLDCLAECPSPGLASIWVDIRDHISAFKNLPAELADREQAGQHNTIYHQEIPGGLERIVTAISVGGIARGYLSLVGIAGDFDTLDQLIAEQGSNVCAVEMARTKAVREAEKRLKGDLLTALLQETLSPRDAHLWVETMGLDLTQAHVCLRFTWDVDSPPSQRRLETLVNYEVANRELKAIIRSIENEMVCFCQIKPDGGRPEQAIQLGDAVLKRGIQEYPKAPIRCGIGTPAHAIKEWGTSFRQAGQALQMSHRLSEDKALYYPDLSVYRLLMQLEHHPDLKAFKDEILGSLIRYESGGELLHTLDAYFEHNGNLSKTAESLYIHRNTLIYRMERIAEISGLDLNHEDTRLAVQLALRIHRMVDIP